MSIKKNKKEGENPIKTYYANIRNHSFNVPVLTDQPCTVCRGDGKIPDPADNKKTVDCSVCKGVGHYLQKVAKPNVVGQQSVIGNQLQWLEELLHFTNIRSSNQYGYVSLYEVYKDTPRVIVDELESMALDQTVDCVMFEDDFTKSENPERFAEIEKNRKLKEENQQLLDRLDKNAPKVENAEAYAKSEVKKAKAEVEAKYSTALKDMQDKVNKLEKESK